MPITLPYNLKFKNGNSAYSAIPIAVGDFDLSVSSGVSPEMYGAVGDGVTDDTTAWQAALDTGRNVFALSGKYKVGTLTVSKNCVIDCNNAEFICTATKLFDIHGEVKVTLTGQNSYTANEHQYAIQSETYGNYTGFGMLIGTNNFEETRSYYYGGFVCTFNNGIMNERYPIDVTNGTNNVTLQLINPITVYLKNISGVSYSGSSDSAKNYIVIKYGYGCVLENIQAELDDFYAFIDLQKSLNCVLQNLRINSKMGSSGTNSYLVAFSDSSFCTVKDSYLFNKYWHCVTTGNSYLCYHNTVENCSLLCDSGGAFVDHPNGINTIVKGCTVCGIGIGGLGVVEDCVILRSSSGCNINIFPTTGPLITGADIINVRFNNTNSASITVRPNPYQSDVRYYVDNIYIADVKITKKTGSLSIGYNIDSVISDLNAYFTIGDIIVSDCYATIDFNSDSPNVTRTGEHIVLRNCSRS